MGSAAAGGVIAPGGYLVSAETGQAPSLHAISCKILEASTVHRFRAVDPALLDTPQLTGRTTAFGPVAHSCQEKD